LYYIAALKFACMMAIEAGVVPPVVALLSDVFDVRKEVCCLCKCVVFAVAKS